MADNKMDKLRNLKADNQLEAEELDQVAGGNRSESIKDADFLNELMRRAGKNQRIYIRRYQDPLKQGETYWCADRTALLDAWASVGVNIIDTHTSNSNQYFIDGKQVSRETAFIHAQKKTGVFL